MKYPRKDRFLTFRRISKNRVRVENKMLEEYWDLNLEKAYFLKLLNGKRDPYKIFPDMSKKNIDILLEEFEDEGLFDCYGRVMKLGLGSVLISLFNPNIKKAHRKIARFWNRFLLLSWLPVLILGLYVYIKVNWDYVTGSYSTLNGYIWGLGGGLLLHELSHAAACIGYGGEWYEIGIGLHCFIPSAYVLINYDDLTNRYKRAQISAAGCEANIFLAGLFLCLLKLGIFDSGVLIIAAFINGLLGVFNCSLLDGVDGLNTFQEFFDRNFCEKAKRLVFDKRAKHMLRRKGINGRVTILASYFVCFLQSLLPVILILNIGSIIRSFL